MAATTGPVSRPARHPGPDGLPLMGDQGFFTRTTNGRLGLVQA